MAGVQLNQYDADVFFEALHRARDTPIETECRLSAADFLRSIRRGTSAREYEDLDQSLNRLQSVVVAEWTAYGERFEFRGHLIDTVTRATDTKLYHLTFSRRTLTLFAAASFTRLEWAERMKITGQPLAEWLHSFYCSHAEPYPLTVAYLHQMTGSRQTSIREFKRDLAAAFGVLGAAIGWRAAWGDPVPRNAGAQTVTVDRRPSAAQARHIERKASVRKKGKRDRDESRRQRGPTPLLDVVPDVLAGVERARRGRKTP